MNKTNEKNISILCDGMGISVLKFSLSMRNAGFNVKTIVIDKRPRTISKSLEVQSQNNNWARLRSARQKSSVLQLIKKMISSLLAILGCHFFNIGRQNINNSFSEAEWEDIDAMIIYSSTGLLSKIDITDIGIPILNIHPAKLPEFRGLDAPYWARLARSQDGVSGYLVDAGIDTGKVIDFIPLEGAYNVSLAELKKELNRLKFRSYPDVLRLFFNSKKDLIKSSILKNQNKGPMSKSCFLDLASGRGGQNKLPLKLAYVSTSDLSSLEANLIHVFHQSESFSNFLSKAELFVASKNTKSSIPLIDEGDNDSFKITICKQITKFRQIDIAIRALTACFRSKFDIVLSRNLYFSFVFSLFRYHVFEFHSIPSDWRRHIFRRVVKNKKVQLICISENLKNDSMAAFKFSEDKIIVLHDAASPAPKKTRLKKVHLLKEKGKFYVGYFGHLHEGRGIEIIEALAEKLKDIDFHVFGGDGKLVDFRQHKNSKQKNLVFHGHIPYLDARLMMVECDLLMLPYQNKTFLKDGKTNTGRWMSPLKLFEYMASKVAIVSSDLPVLKEILSHNKNCLLVNPSDIEAWENAILCLKNDKSKAARLAQNALNQYETYFSWNERARRILLECM